MFFESCVAVCIVLIYWYCNLRRPCPHQEIRFASSLPPSLPQPNDSESQPSGEGKAAATSPTQTNAKNPTKQEVGDESSESRSTFDYVVVGGGPAGFAAAVTLLLSTSSQPRDASARKDGPVTVALLERGPFTPTGGMPDLFSFTHDLRHGVLDQGSAPQLRPFAATLDAKKEDGSGTVDHEDGSVEKGKGTDESILSSSLLLQQQQQPYPRGATLGGTQLLDWGVYFAPAPLGDDQPFDARVLALAKKQTSFAVCRSPLSWGAAESAGQHERLTKALPAVSAGDETNPSRTRPHNNHKKATKQKGDEDEQNGTNCGTVQPLQIWMDPTTGVRRHLHRHWYDLQRSATTHQQQQQHLHIYRNATVLDFVREGAACVGVRARCISSSPNTRKVCLFRVRKGVILCAGAMQTPWLAAKLLRHVGLGADSSHHHNNSNQTNKIIVPWNDSIGVPLVYEARPGMSDDAVNVHRSLKSIAAWYLARRGPFLNVVTDTMMEFPSDVVPGAVVRIFVLPAAGFHRLRFQKLGLDVHLGLFEEAMMFWVTVAKFPSSCLLEEGRSITTLRYSTSSSTNKEEDAARGESVPVAHIQPLRDPAVRTQVRQVLREGLSVCRDIAQVAPLRQLISGREAVDISLFPEASQRITMKALYADLLARSQQKGSGQTTGLASLLTQRRATRSMNPPPTSAGAAAQFSPQEITAAREEAVRVVHSDPYMDAYIEKHSQWMGFGSGSSSLQVRREENGNNRLKEVSNVWIGDASAVAVPSSASQSSTSDSESTGMAEEEGQTVFEGGGVMTAMMCGAVAARSAVLLAE